MCCDSRLQLNELKGHCPDILTIQSFDSSLNLHWGVVIYLIDIYLLDLYANDVACMRLRTSQIVPVQRMPKVLTVEPRLDAAL